MIKSLATFSRIHRPSEYKEYLSGKEYLYSVPGRKRVRQVIKATVINDGKEYTFKDWIQDYEDYCENDYWQCIHDCAETIRW